MKPSANDIVLRPRFQLETEWEKNSVIEAFKNELKSPFKIKNAGDHVFIRFDEEHTSFWSPQLHLEVVEEEEEAEKSKIYGLFGPSPTLWTFFIFLHFGIATVFVIFGIWGYSNWSIQQPYALQTAVCVFMVILWFGLYLFGRIGKSQGKEQMHLLHNFMKDTLKTIK
ncbi:GTP-binding protein [Ascidiimonas sp. W6]|uniref:GTP-binding protein n=1 Tax=Ascidiimonas meishanensis TaxID=3128903 RepID=UPI0030EE5546